ncbi:hypothetical protein [Arsukibacterium sp.]|uniref:hypothetical protein n=1 Tax=Arsukibacterium sp. TaxID=1977258 RepID=UPI002FDA22A2
MKKRTLQPDEPLLHACHSKPVTRRDFISCGLALGGGILTSGSLFGLFANPGKAYAQLSPDLEALKLQCGINVQGAGKIPFICFDLAGGANFAGSNVLIGGAGGQLDFISTQGYSRQGLPADMLPSAGLVDQQLGLAFHSDSQLLRGILERTSGATQAQVNGSVIPSRSENDTGNNPHNPMYAIAKAGANGSLMPLIGSRNSDSGANSMAPTEFYNPEWRPTKIDRPSDVTGLVDVGDLFGLLDQSDAVAVMESIQRISHQKMGRVNTGVNRDEVIKDLMRCGYVKSADLADRFGNPATLDPAADPDIVGAAGIFSVAEFNGDAEFRKTASVMKLVVNGFAGAGTITIGGYDYHTGERGTGELRDLRAGRCIGACLEYAARMNQPLMIYIYSDGSVSSNGRIDDSVNGRGKGEWTGDSSATAASIMMVYNPMGRPQLLGSSPLEQARRQQLGFMRPDGSVETGSSMAANNVNLLVQTVLLNYLALHGEQGRLAEVAPFHGLGNAASIDRLTAFAPII